ncbi:MAG: hypothetical protein MJ134_06670 [Lachnospiraceae bacterium]|nr:hypothetical protein [Lachnospiraceae bacterium]
MKKIITLALCACLLVSLLGGCGSKQETKSSVGTSVEENAIETEDTDVEPTEEDEALLPDAGEMDITSLPVTNNCAYFVKVGDYVYFREYGKNALDQLAIWGGFLDHPTGEQSLIKCYNEETGELSSGFIDFGYGKMVFSDGVFFLNGLDYSKTESDYGLPYVYSVDMEGKEVSMADYVAGEITGITPDATMFFTEGYSYGEEYFSLITGVNTDGSAAFTISSPNTLTYLGCTNDYMIYSENFFQDDIAKIMSMPISSSNQEDAIEIMEMETDYYQYLDYGKVTFDRGNNPEETLYLPIAKREGTGAMFTDGMVIGFQADQPGSGFIKEDIGAEEEFNFEMPYISVDNGIINFYDKEPNTYYIKYVALEELGDLQSRNSNDDFEKPGDLQYRNASAEDELIVAEFISGANYYEEKNHLLIAENVNGICYTMRCDMVYDEEGSIGWRDGFRLLNVDYIIADHSGQYNILSSIEAK